MRSHCGQAVPAVSSVALHQSLLILLLHSTCSKMNYSTQETGLLSISIFVHGSVLSTMAALCVDQLTWVLTYMRGTQAAHTMYPSFIIRNWVLLRRPPVFHKRLFPAINNRSNWQDQSFITLSVSQPSNVQSFYSYFMFTQHYSVTAFCQVRQTDFLLYSQLEMKGFCTRQSLVASSHTWHWQSITIRIVWMLFDHFCYVVQSQ